MGKKKNIRRILHVLKSKDVLWHIFVHAQDPWKSRALERLIKHPDLRIKEAQALLPLAKIARHTQRLLVFLWNWDKKAFFEAAKHFDPAWDFLEENLPSIRRGSIADHLIESIKDDPCHRQRAWRIFQGLGLPREYYQEILGLPDLNDFNSIKLQATKKLGSPKGPDKIARIIVERSRKRA